MATNTYVALKSVTISGTSTNDVTITGIPQGYTDLVIVTNLNNIGNVAVLRGQFNGDTTTSYSSTSVHGSGSAAGSSRQSNVDAFYMTYQGHVDGTKSTGIYHIMNYSNSTTYKTVISRASSASFGVDATVSLWRKTDPITSIRIVNDRAEYWTAGSTINIYGIASEEASAKATGGTIVSDSTYFYHIFTSSGTFTPKQSLTVDYLVVAGGGSGVASRGGGGGAGGLRSTVAPTGGGGSAESPLSLTASTAYTVTVGAGGASPSYGATSGSNSVFSTITATGGGGGAAPNQGFAGLSGGSGGGGAYGLAAGSASPSGQGYAGGSGNGTYIGGAGGGGAGAVGSNASSTNNNGGNGGNGVLNTSWSTATSTGINGYYAGGGGGGFFSDGGTAGGTGGLGGGGNGKTNSVAAQAGTPNTGGGGGSGKGNPGGIGDSIDGANGGSGLVIVRYAK